MPVKRNRRNWFLIILTFSWRISFMDVLRNERVQNVGKRTRGTLNDFEKFILRGNVVDLAVGIVIGAAFTAVVNAFVNGIITPLIPGNGKVGLSNLTIPVPFTGSELLVGA